MNYNELLIFLKNNYDEQKSEFDKKIINSNLKHYGIKTNVLRRIAREISCDNSYLVYPINESYECDFIIGVSMAYSKNDLKTKLEFYNEFFKKIDNWAIVDVVSSTLKIKDNCYDETFDYIKRFINSEFEFLSRFGYILFMTNFLNDNHLNDLFNIINLKEKRYYVMMAQAWLLSNAYIKYPKKIYDEMKKMNKDNDILKYAIRKILDSRRVSDEDKKMIKELRG